MDIYEVLRTKPHNERHLARYVKFIQSRQLNLGPTERHHICPKAKDLFPEYKSFKDFPWNMIRLTLREHYIAHLLLWKTFGGSQAFSIQSMSRTKIRSSRLYESMRAEATALSSAAKIGRVVSEETKAKIAATLKGRRLSEETKIKMSSFHLGKAKSLETKARMSQAQLGKTLTAEHRMKISQSLIRS